MDAVNERSAGFIDPVLRWVAFVCIGSAVSLGPWFFGAWEAWWFWPFVAVIWVAVAAMGLRMTVISGLGNGRRAALIALVSVVPFLVYAGIRTLSTEAVMDAQRSFLLHATAVAVAAVTAFCLNGRQRRILYWLIFANLLLLGLYGLVNHVGWGSRLVMWAPRYEQYAGRATGPYFCPDHFAGAMELMLCMAIGLLADKERGAVVKWVAGVVSIVAVSGVVISQSRGAGMTLVVILAAAMIWGVAQWPLAVRWNLRLIAVCGGLLLLMGGLHFGGAYVDRFVSYDGWRVGVGQGASGAEPITESLLRTCRGRMYGGAVRAWKSAPLLGIGPGMHQNLWPHFAPTSDGDPDIGRWPTLVNDYMHSYEVHSDWLQLLEEYGVVGMVLFLVALFTVFGLLTASVSSAARRRQADSSPSDRVEFAHAIGAVLAVAAMTFHSLGDFNLQMPATVWILAAMVAVPLAGTADVEELDDL